MGRARVWLSEPLLHFAAIGAALFALHARVGPSSDQDAAAREIVVTQGRLRSLADTFARQWSRPPTRDELTGLVRDFVREEVLVREASALGLDQGDTVVRRRLAQKMEFLWEDVAPAAPPTEADLRAFFAARPELFRGAPRVTFSQVFLERGTRGDALERDAARLLAALNAPGGRRRAVAAGDSRLLPTHFEDVPLRDVEAQFGQGFAERLAVLDPGRFVGPVESGYGAHLVRVQRRTPGCLRPFAEVRDAVARRWAEEKRQETRDGQLRALLARYRVTVEAGARPTPAPLPGDAP